MSAVTVSALTKDYGDVRGNDEVSFTVAEGEVFGYLGPNGAGKTTTIRTLMGFQSPTSGSATVLGADVRDEDALIEARKRIGYLPANPAFDENVTGDEILDLHASVKGDSRRGELLDLFSVPVEREVREYSTGQQQKLGLVQAFMHDPDLVVLDEPTAGLDPLVQRRFNEFVQDEKAAGTTVFLSSHVLSEVRRVCDRIGIIRDGRIVTVETVSDLLQRAGKFVRVRVAADLSRTDVPLDGVHELTAHSLGDAYAELPMASTGGGRGEEAQRAGPVTEFTFTYTAPFDALVDYLGDFHVLELDVEEAPLEQVFMRFYDDEPVEAANDGKSSTRTGDDDGTTGEAGVADDAGPTDDAGTASDAGPTDDARTTSGGDG